MFLVLADETRIALAPTASARTSIAHRPRRTLVAPKQMRRPSISAPTQTGAEPGEADDRIDVTSLVLCAPSVSLKRAASLVGHT